MPISFRASIYSLFCFFQALLFHYVYWLMLLSRVLTTESSQFLKLNCYTWKQLIMQINELRE